MAALTWKSAIAWKEHDMQKINVIISKTGEVKVDAIGFQGGACEEATKRIINNLGLATGSEKKPEYWQDVDQIQTNLN